jgi:hypothetical protein
MGIKSSRRGTYYANTTIHPPRPVIVQSPRDEAPAVLAWLAFLVVLGVLALYAFDAPNLWEYRP